MEDRSVGPLGERGRHRRDRVVGYREQDRVGVDACAGDRVGRAERHLDASAPQRPGQTTAHAPASDDRHSHL